MSSSVTLRWLRQNVHNYDNKDRVCSDIESALAAISTLRPKSAWHTFDDGRTQLLLCVHGLLPITFKSASYNIPIDLWITRDYPRHPPIVYVVPTSDMLVKPGKYIDVSGRCNLEYMQQWERKSEGCSILALLENMQDLFSRQPPVYAKPKADPTLTSTLHTAGAEVGVSSIADTSPARTLSPPQPSSSRATAISSASLTPGYDQTRPVLPPKPGSVMANPPNHSVYNPAVTSQSTVVSPQPSASQSNTSAPASPPPLPPLPGDLSLPQYHQPHATYHSIPPVYRHLNPVPATTNASSHVANSSHQYWMTSPPSHPSTVPPSSPPVLPLPPLASTLPYTQLPSQLTSQTMPPSVAMVPPPPPPSIPPPNLLDQDDAIIVTTPSQLPVINQTTVPPPRPPNPELLSLHAQVHQKITSELASLSQALTLDADRLRTHQSDLLAGEPAIRDEMARLEAVRDVCRNVSDRLKDSVAHAERNVAELRRKGDPEVDELVCSTTIIHNQ
ncbi:hypothetical protein ONZ45_g2779 [Pleurotus djamor]|nr:hypothetical protein ONZ45_g2779 [Pleurotus djamor]